MSSARLMLSAQRLAARPYGGLFASATDSSGVRNVIATSTGPKTSTCAIMRSEAALAVAAESGRRVDGVRGVDPYHAALQLRRDVEREVDALGPEAGRETVRRVVRERDGFFRRAKRHCDEDRAEDFDLRDH